jgi:F0F1-type ATP synthase assembly protein I
MKGISNAAGRAGQAEQAVNEEAGRARATGLGQGWTVMSYMLSGLVAYGAIGWLIARVTHVQLLFPIGMMVGIAVSVGYVIYRFGRQGAVEQAAARRASAAEAEAVAEAAAAAPVTGPRSAGRAAMNRAAMNRAAATTGRGTTSAQQRAHHVDGSVERNDR